MNAPSAWSSLDAASAAQAERDGAAAAARLRLPVDRVRWRGAAGSWRGRDLGSSLDFADHRRYVAGDDPRRIHWAAYARTGQVLMKLYHAEASPVVDVGLDVSASMAVGVKARSAAALLGFVVASAGLDGAQVRAFVGAGRAVRVLDTAAVRSGRWMQGVPGGGRGAPGPFPWRASSFRVVVTDLLFEDDPGPWLEALTRGAGGTILLVPYAAEEAAPDWDGNVELHDAEGGERRLQRVDADLRRRYAAAYARHFALWRDACRRRGVGLARVAAGRPLVEALVAEAVAEGVVEARR